MELWYRQPARAWTEALPLGNGALGAMVHGGADEELICLNLDTLWSGYPRETNRPGAAVRLAEARRLAASGRFLQAQQLIEEHMLGDFTQSYLPLGDLTLRFSPAVEPAAYRRSLDLDSALSVVRYEAGGALYTRECFVSHPDRCLALRVSASRPGGVSCAISLSSPLRAQAAAAGSRLTLEGVAPSQVDPAYLAGSPEPVRYDEPDDRKGMRFFACAAVEARGGRVRARGGSLCVEGADALVLRLAAGTSFNGFDKQPFTQGVDCRAVSLSRLAAAEARPFGELLTRHVADYRALYARVRFSLGSGPGRDDLPTDERLARFAETGRDPRLYELLFGYGRYLLIASSREGTQPANLQGIWNRELRPPWSSNYTLNINTKMNYWAAERCNLPELLEPLFRLTGELRVTGARTARVHYGARGAVAHHNTDLWRLSNPVGKGQPGSAGYAFWRMGYAWLCRHLFEHYAYTRDLDFLRCRAYPAIRDAALFFLDTLTEGADGKLWISPSTSPENAFLADGGVCGVAAGASMDLAIVREVFRNTLACCALLHCDGAFAGEVREALGRLAPYRAGTDGRLLEWDQEHPESDPHHRHLSHLYPLCPGDEITPRDTPELAEACRKTLLARGDEGAGWSLGWKVCAWARLGDGRRALRLLKLQLRLAAPGQPGRKHAGGVYPNLLGAHPPFQIDGNFAALAGIAEMLLQTRGDDIFLLPALPDEWSDGAVEGLRAPQRITVGIRFRGGALLDAALTAERDCTARVSYHGAVLPISLRAETQLVLYPSNFAVSGSAPNGSESELGSR